MSPSIKAGPITLVAVAAAAVLAGVCSVAFGQQASRDGELKFEVATVKPSDPEGAFKGPNDPLHFVRRRETLAILVATAFDMEVYQVSGGPAWASTERFDVEAKPERPATPAQMRQMLRALLADRFQLACHGAMRPVAAYALIVAKGGPKIGPQFHVHKEGAPGPVGVQGQVASSFTMKVLASMISVYLRHPFPSAGAMPVVPYEELPVVDQTGLKGEYDIILDLRRNRDWAVVLNEQLGLSLVPRKAEVETMIIDRAVRPGEN